MLTFGRTGRLQGLTRRRRGCMMEMSYGERGQSRGQICDWPALRCVKECRCKLPAVGRPIRGLPTAQGGDVKVWMIDEVAQILLGLALA